MLMELRRVSYLLKEFWMGKEWVMNKNNNE